MMASNATSPSASGTPNGSANNIVAALGHAFKSQTGEPLSGDRIAQLLLANMGQLGELAKQGKLNQQQIMQLKDYADKHKSTIAAASASPPQASPVPVPAPAPTKPGLKPYSTDPMLASATPENNSPAPSPSLNVSNPGPVNWTQAQLGRPTLTGGIAGGRVAGTPAQVNRGSDDTSLLNMDGNRTTKRNTPADQSMRRSIQDLVSSIDPNVKVEAEVEDLLLDIADEFVDSVTNFGCRLAKHRGGDTLEVRDLQLHLERNHNIRIPGFSSDETRIALSQTLPVIPPSIPSGPAGGKKGHNAQGTHMTLRSHRLAQVGQAKREGKLV